MEEFTCGNLTYLGCKRMDIAKELMALNNDGICANICCNNCDKFTNCAYKCQQANKSNQYRLNNFISEELQQELLLGIKCYNCQKEINQQGHMLNILSEETDSVWLCDECYNYVCGNIKEDL